jgi:copper chaperone CopZ
MKLARAFCLGLLLLACRASGPAAPAVRTVVLSIGGMTCAVDCPPRVEAALESVAGVQSATVDYDARTATVLVSGELATGALISALQKQGFGGMVRE